MDEADAGTEPPAPTHKRSDGGCSVAHTDAAGPKGLLPGFALGLLLMLRRMRRRRF